MKPLAVLGTSSDAGKTKLVMALCRILADRGMKVALFKAQNVSNNSAVTREGREISRAQCLQAEAARVEPSYLFNPVLLKSHGNGSVQVIVNGLVYQNQSIVAYYVAITLKPLIQLIEATPMAIIVKRQYKGLPIVPRKIWTWIPFYRPCRKTDVF